MNTIANAPRNAIGEAGALFGEGLAAQGENLGSARDFLFGAGTPEVAGSTLGGPDRRGLDEVQVLIKQSEQIMPQFEAIQSLQSAPLDAQSQIAVEQLRIQLEQQAADLQLQLQQAQTNLDVQNQMFNAWETAAFGEAGLLPGVSPEEAARLNTALDAGGENAGVGPELLEAIDAVMSSSLSGDAKMQRIDFILDQQGVQQEARVGINDFTQNLTDIEKLQESTDVELLINQGIEPNYVQPAFNLDLSSDPAMRGANAAGTYVDDYLASQGIVLSPDQEALVGDFLLSTGGQFDFENPATQNQITAISTQLGVDPTSLQDAFQNGAKAAEAREEAWNTAVTKSRLEPGSEGMAIAIYQTFIDKFGDSPEAEAMAQSLAESVQLHALIKAKSDGKAGTTRGGSQMGVGGLSESAYTALGYDVKETKGNMQMELSALIDYIMQNFGGDPRQALAYYYGTGEWGN
jgi:hypothetical protein